MIKSETDWLDVPCNCDSCNDTYSFGYLITTAEGDNICEDCAVYIELNKIARDSAEALKNK
jgi:hypothetical protein